tara:strand:- start:390 stop:791 length:402 start_codon:yes stop_codon:yes gene_type:complete
MSNPIKAKDVELSSTVDVILHHNYPLEIIKTKNGLRWEVVRNRGGAKSKFTTHIVGSVMKNDIANTTFHIYGGPYAGSGLGFDFLSKGDNETAVAVIPWNYIMRMAVLEQKEIPQISQEYGRLNIIKTPVIFY